MNFSGDLHSDLAALGLPGWYARLLPLIEERASGNAHGDMPAWQAALRSLPEISVADPELNAPCVRLLREDLTHDQQQQLRAALLQLSPWRKGPFNIGGVFVDTEWRSDLKWQRVQNAVRPLAGKRILDVGCGNGYYALRMLGAGASCVVGVDPTLLYLMQFKALQHFLPQLPVHVLPLRSQELPGPSGAFDTVMSMGVLYHQRSPLDHLRELRGHLRPGGELLLETLVLPGEQPFARTPEDRYARMRNVWLLPTVAELTIWLQRSGFIDVCCHGVTATTSDEQRSTEWMPFESLRESLDPGNPGLTVEGWPAPARAILTAATPA
ncbi:MAG: tRNA 5-methoxyuridine(34)/uridine 5-oxyacetic acid(34) synthase CmoB [Woeseia sp.]